MSSISTQIKNKFYTSYSPPPSLSEPKCPEELQNYEYDKTERKLIKTDKIPFYKEIQSHYDATKLSSKLSRFAMGDFSALGYAGGSYSDVSGSTTNLAQILATKQIAETEFGKLPNDIKQLFNGNYSEFVRSIEDGTFEQRLVEYAKSKQQPGTPGGSGTDGAAGSAAS